MITMVESLSPERLSDIRAFEREWVLLRECVSPCFNAQLLEKSFHSFDWPRLLLLAEEHGVIGQLASCLNDHNSLAVPPLVKQAILERQRRENFLTLRLTAELFCLLELFSANGISALVIKGPVLASVAYGDPSLRSYGDIDLLVRQDDIRRATELLMASGYQATVSLDSIDSGKIPGQYLFSKRDSKLLVELHNNLTLRYFPRPLPIEELFSRQIRVRLDAHEVPAPSLEDHLAIVCVHGAKHFWERLSSITDVAGLVSRQTSIDWERAEAHARAVEAEHLLHTGLRLAADVLHAELPEAISSPVRRDHLAAKLATRVLRWLPSAGYAPPSLFERAAFRLRMRGNFLAAPAYLLRLSLSPTEEDWQDRGNISSSRFLDALRRPLRLVRKYSRRIGN
ncbi:MAG TPA: nucleotidyltransferase family protein [Candidatus Dormibacteraeota bacterium]|nr:nucleotidyltransferase family protein [Candidatus Dormibacteraeota bacterium]